MGQIPSEIGNLESLQTLVLSKNTLGGPLPSEMGNFRSIQSMLINDNFLSGEIPDIFDDFTELTWLQLSNNTFQGPIPSSLWNLRQIDMLGLERNDVTGLVPNRICDKVDDKHLTIDDSPWFVEKPKVECPCCSERAECYIWEITQSTYDTLPCPTENVYNIDQYEIHDHISSITYSNTFPSTNDAQAQFCLSPTGCYKLSEDSSVSNNPLMFNFSYTKTSHNLMQDDVCDSVQICGHQFVEHHPKRRWLNHITQLVDPDWSDTDAPQHDALCWVLTQDKVLDNYSICDGTLLQRYVMTLLFLKSENLKSLLDNQLHSIHTCDWPGISCDSRQQFVEAVDLSNENLSGRVFTEIGLLRSLKIINLSNNNLSGSIDEDTYTTLPELSILDLSKNKFEGKFPKELLEIKTLRELRLAQNQLFGSLSDEDTYARNLGKSLLSIFCHIKVHLK